MGKTPISEVMAAKFVDVISKNILKGRHAGFGAVNLKDLGEKAGIKNLGTVLKRPGISLQTCCKIIAALKASNKTPDFSQQLDKELIKALASCN